MITCRHVVCNTECSEFGHLGDLFWSLCFMKHLNQPIELFLECRDGINFEQVKRVLILQSYIDRVVPHSNLGVDYDLTDSNRCDTSVCLLDSYFDTYNVQRPDHRVGWLADTSTEKHGTMIYRYTRYRNPNFDWAYYIRNESIDLNDCFFVGKHHEYIQFLIAAKLRPSELVWQKTNTLMDLYNTICGAKNVICNAGLPYVIAAGLGTRVVLENSNRANSPFLMLIDDEERPINVHNVMNRDSSIYYQTYNPKRIVKL